MASPPLPASFDVDPDWKTLLAPLEATSNLGNLQTRCHLVFTLLIFLGLSVREFLFFLFESAIPEVKQRVGIFMGNSSTHGFAPARLFKAWHDRFPRCIPHLHESIIKPCMEEIALQESDRVINDPRLKIRLIDCTLDFFRNILNPGVLPDIYSEDAPFTWDFLTVFTTSPNEYRKRRARKGKKGRKETTVEDDEWEETPESSAGDDTQFAGDTGGIWKEMGEPRRLQGLARADGNCDPARAE